MSDTLTKFWAKVHPTGSRIKAPMKVSDQTKALDKNRVAGAAQVTNLVAAYENIDPKTDPDCSQRMKALKNVEAAIYKWFSHTAAPSLSEVKGSKEMATILKKAERAHEQLVEATKDDPAVAPFDTSGMAPLEVQRRTDIWRSIIDNTGQMKLGGSKNFQKRTAAQLAKMLQTDTGTDILEFLSKDKTTPPDPNDRVVLGDKLPTEFQTDHFQSVDADVSYAKEISPGSAKDLGVPAPVDGNEDAMEFPTLTKSEDLRAAMLSGAKGVIVAGKKYTFSGGTGSFVKVVPPKAGGEDSETAGPGNSEIITPPFITLAHELGHAVNIRSGAATRDHSEMMGALCRMQDPTLSDDEIENRWSNSEEFFNISNIENGMRKDCGIPPRTAHKPCTAMVKLDQLTVIGKRYGQLTAKDECYNNIDVVTDFQRLLAATKAKINEPGVMDILRNKLDEVDTALSDDGIISFKKQNLLRDWKWTETAFEKKESSLPTSDKKVTEYRDIEDKVTNHVDTVVAIGTKNWSVMKIRMRELRSSLA